MALRSIYTIGVYGSTETEFFRNLTSNQIDTFCDIRRRRAVRGAIYAFVNSARLQDKLKSLSINYIHETRLAPTIPIMGVQDKSDKLHKVKRRERTELDDAFKKAYTDKILSKFDIKEFIGELEKSGCKKVVLFCVEKLPTACHRSLVTDKIKKLFPRIRVTNL
jgi:hypothetical protein